jgi:uncharacterized protein YndB with AHSA1/START domain
MPHEFELRKEVVLSATPDQVWAAIATGPGIDAWFMGRNRVEPREGGRSSMTIGEHTSEATVTAWEPPRRFAYRDDSPDGVTFMAFEWLIEGRDDGTCVLRLVQSGVLGDDWETEYDALGTGWDMYLHQLGQYLRFFPGRPATPVTVMGPGPADPEAAWAGLRRGLGLDGPPTEGDRVRLTPDGLAAVDGVVDYLSPDTLGVRAGDGLYRFSRGFNGMVFAGHHLFAAGLDPDETERAWQAWVDRLFGQPQEKEDAR